MKHSPANALLGGMSAADFMRRHWQREPLLIRQAAPEFEGRFSRARLLELATRDEVESRLVYQQGGRWQVRSGPHEAQDLAALKRRWTVLVQGANLFDPHAQALMERFRFIPDARLDDVMISYATDGAGVGAHFDSYDVFLLQTQGRRRWRVSRQRDLSLVEGAPLKILSRFEPDQEWLLEPGDMLYLPPHMAHEGVAVGESVTCSIGFKAPLGRELLSEFFYHLAERLADDDPPAGASRARLDARYADPEQGAVRHPAQLPALMLQSMQELLTGISWKGTDIERFLGAYLSEPKANVFFTPPSMRAAQRFAEAAARSGIELDAKSILLYHGPHFFFNGETFAVKGRRDGGTSKGLRQLADARQIDAKLFVTLANDSLIAPLLHEWYRAGWLRIRSLTSS